jgi:hypothetical protein
MKEPTIVAVTLCENPVSSSHIGANDSAAQGKVPATPCATIAKNVGIFTTNLASLKACRNADARSTTSSLLSSSLQ